MCPERETAILEGRRTYQSDAPCKRGHVGERRTVNNMCVECHRSARKRRPAHYRKVHRKWRNANMHKVAEYKGHSAPTRSKPDRCECCARRKKLYMDHDHVTLKFRGWICVSCNSGIGLLGDSVIRVQRAADYLKLTNAA